MLTTLTTTIKENPMTVLLSSSGSIIALVAALFTVDARYAHADGVEKDKTEMKQAIQESSTAIRRQMLEDKIFELDLRKSQNKNNQLSPIDQALRDRYQQQLNNLKKSRNPQ